MINLKTEFLCGSHYSHTCILLCLIQGDEREIITWKYSRLHEKSGKYAINKGRVWGAARVTCVTFQTCHVYYFNFKREIIYFTF